MLLVVFGALGLVANLGCSCVGFEGWSPSVWFDKGGRQTMFD